MDDNDKFGVCVLILIVSMFLVVSAVYIRGDTINS